MNFKIIQGTNGTPEMSWDLADDDITTNIYWSTYIMYGTMFNLPKFGLNMKGIDKVSDLTVTLFKTRLDSALKWLLDIGKATKIIVIVEKDVTNIYRINYKITATQADGIPVTVTNFITVGGPSSGFTFP